MVHCVYAHHQLLCAHLSEKNVYYNYGLPPSLKKVIDDHDVVDS